VEYRPIQSRWIVLALAVLIFLSALCEMAAGDSFDFPRVLWLVPAGILSAGGVSLLGILIQRHRRRT
jgi:hypothetical protein